MAKWYHGMAQSSTIYFIIILSFVFLYQLQSNLFCFWHINLSVLAGCFSLSSFISIYTHVLQLKSQFKSNLSSVGVTGGFNVKFLSGCISTTKEGSQRVKVKDLYNNCQMYYPLTLINMNTSSIDERLIIINDHYNLLSSSTIIIC